MAGFNFNLDGNPVFNKWLLCCPEDKEKIMWKVFGQLQNLGVDKERLHLGMWQLTNIASVKLKRVDTITKERCPPQSRRKRRRILVIDSDSDNDEEGNEIGRRQSRHQVDGNGASVFGEKPSASVERDNSRTRMVKAKQDKPFIDLVESEPETQEMVADKKEKGKQRSIKSSGSDLEDEITSYIVFKEMEKSVCTLEKIPNSPCGSSDIEYVSEDQMPNYTHQDSRLKASPSSVGAKVLTDGQICESIPVTDRPEDANIAINGQLNIDFHREALVLVDSPPEVSGTNEEGRFTFVPVSDPGLEEIFEEKSVPGGVKDKELSSPVSEIQVVDLESKEENHVGNELEATVSSSGLPASPPVSASPNTDTSKAGLIRVKDNGSLGISENWDKHNKAGDQNVDKIRVLRHSLQSYEKIKQFMPEDIKKLMDYVCSRLFMLIEDSRENKEKIKKYQAMKPSDIIEEYKEVIKKRIEDMIEITVRCISKKILKIEEYLKKEECVHGILMALLMTTYPSILDDFAFSCRIVKNTYWLARKANAERSEPQTRSGKDDSFPSLGLFSSIHPLRSKPHMLVNTESSCILPNTLQKQNPAASIMTAAPQQYTVSSAPVQHGNEFTVSNHAAVAESSVLVQRSAHTLQYPPPPLPPYPPPPLYHQTAKSIVNEERLVLQRHLQQRVELALPFQQQQVQECLPQQPAHCQLQIHLPNESVPGEQGSQQRSQQHVNSSQQLLQHQAESEEMQQIQRSQQQIHQQTQQLLQFQQSLHQQTQVQHWQLQEQAPISQIQQPQYVTQSQAQHLRPPRQLVQQHLQLQQQLQQAPQQFLLQSQIQQQPQLQQPQAQQQSQVLSQQSQPAQLGQPYAAHQQASLEQQQKQMQHHAQLYQPQQQVQQQLYLHQPPQETQKQMSLRQMPQQVEQPDLLQEQMLQQRDQQQQEQRQHHKQNILQHLKERAQAQNMSVEQYAHKLFNIVTNIVANKEGQTQSQQQHDTLPLQPVQCESFLQPALESQISPSQHMLYDSSQQQHF